MTADLETLWRNRPPMAAALVPAPIRQLIARQQSGLCFYCDAMLPQEAGQIKGFVMDHLVPRSAGGSHKPDNRVASCPRCDGEKKSRMPTEDELLRKRIQWGLTV